MSATGFADPGAAEPLFSYAAWLLAGVALGSAHFLSLRWNVGLLLEGRVMRSVALQAVRLALAVAAMTAVGSNYGAIPVLLMAGGFLVARFAVLRLAGAP